MKMEEEDKNLLVTNFEDSLKAHENIRPGDMKKWAKDFETEEAIDILENWLVFTGVVFYRKGFFENKVSVI